MLFWITENFLLAKYQSFVFHENLQELIWVKAEVTHRKQHPSFQQR